MAYVNLVQITDVWMMRQHIKRIQRLFGKLRIEINKLLNTRLTAVL